MKYLGEEHIRNAGFSWKETIDVIGDAVGCLARNEFVQPIKPYLRYKNLANRIIAMPAYLGAPFNMCGIKWIASFPGNIQIGLPRAHSILILNDADTGRPEAIINTALVSAIRTASVSGLMIRKFLALRDPKNIRLGIIGFGPIGQGHLRMCADLLGDRLQQVSLFDLKGIDASAIEPAIRDKVVICKDWMEAYRQADIFITCTVSRTPYIDLRPLDGSLHLNVSLRDYKPIVYEWFRDSIIVDDWDEVCREQTDIEIFHLEKGLTRADTRSLPDVVCGNCLASYRPEAPIMFNPMGMAAFDIAIGTYFLNLLSRANNVLILN